MQFPFGMNRDAEGVVLVDPTTGQAYAAVPTSLATGNIAYADAVDVALAAGASTTPNNHMVPPWAARVSVSALSDQPGMLYLFATFDGNVWKQIGSFGITANVETQITRVGLGHKGYRAHVTNGQAPSTSTNVSLSYTVG